MNLPSAEQYLEIIKKKTPGGLAKLHYYGFISNKDGEPFFKKGNYAIVVKAENSSKLYAVRFFLDSEPEIFERYKQIQAYLDNRLLYWKIPFDFLDKEVFVNGEYYPAIKMDWIDSLSLTEYLDSIIENPLLISKLQQQFVALSQNLEKNGISHGNLNMKHIRFSGKEHDPVLKLIDYDSMYIPSFKGKDSVSAGTAGFQHPMRLASDFSETIDRFSFWVFLTALEAFKIDPLLWKYSKQNGFNKEEQILFTYRDLAFPEKSATFQVLKRYHSNALSFYTDKLIRFCNATSLNEIEAPQLYGNNDSYLSAQKEDLLFEATEINNDAVREETELVPADIEPQKPIVYTERTKRTRENESRKGRSTVRLQLPIQPAEEELYVPAKKRKRKPFAVIISTAILLLAMTTYFVRQNPSDQIITPVAAVPKKAVPQIPQQQVPAQQTVFTQANITQFLFQLYRSYNKRNLKSILSNYADSLTEYYDAGAITKDKLNTVIRDLFIKPVHYECNPDLRTLQFNPQGNDSCQLSISINEIIKADRRSKTENYSSKIEYIVDSSFKILAEKNIE